MNTLARAAALAFGGGIAYSLIEPYRIEVRPFVVSFDNLPMEVDGLRIVQLSDLHYSAITPRSILQRAVQLCNDQKPDVIVLTGDYVSRRNSYSAFTLARLYAKPVMDYAAVVAEEMAKLRAPLGIYAVPGNHDRANGCYNAIEELLQSVGIVSLVNRGVLLREALPLVGLDDLRSGRPLVRQALEGIEPRQPHVILSHNPRLIWSVAERNCLMLTGHTHAGQVHLPITNFRRRPRDMRFSELFQGWYKQGRARLYVSSGLGSVHFPMRFRCPPEIPVFTLRQGV